MLSQFTDLVAWLGLSVLQGNYGPVLVYSGKIGYYYE